ncbi:MAG: zinc ABC transporter substrate-binding protein [Sedimentisphaerales bacterium]|nr:zinc ABC transporter substrate-binding protein [Sedimentisphaerales bacterium]
MQILQDRGIRETAALLVVLVAGCRDEGARREAPEIAVTNSYLACAVRDLCGPGTGILCLAPPGMCPGHFDLSPADVRRLAGCRMLLLFDFQQSVEQTLTRLRDKGLKTHLVRAPAGLCVPENYLAVCEETSRILAEAYPRQADGIRERLSAIRERMERLGVETKDAVRRSVASSAAVLVSNHQAGFAQWLGLEPVATFVGTDVETASNIDQCLKKATGQGVRYVIANQQEGTALADALAERLQVKAVVFSNFPQSGDGAGFDLLVRENVRRLTEAVPR